MNEDSFDMPEDDDDDGHWYQKESWGITVRVRPFYLEEQSVPHEERYLWAYQVRIENRGAGKVQLMTRHWRIVDGRGQAIEVEGEGVVGEQPVLAPGETFEYASGTPLSQPSGIMSGTYSMQGEDGRQFDVEIPAFPLESPWSPRTLH